MSVKQPVDPGWIKQLYLSSTNEARYRALLAGIQGDKVVSFGLSQKGREPFFLLWLLNASEISVVEIKAEHIHEFERLIPEMQERTPRGLQGRIITPIVADMSLPVPDLAEGYFDLAYCDNVLYSVNRNQPDLERVQRAINEMARVIRPGGYVVAYEPQMGWQPNVMTYETRDINFMFMQAGLIKTGAQANIPYLYVYKKPGQTIGGPI